MQQSPHCANTIISSDNQTCDVTQRDHNFLNASVSSCSVSERERERERGGGGGTEGEGEMVGRCCSGSGDVLPFAAIVAMECANVGLNTLYKAATWTGMNYYVFIVYAYAIAALLLLPSPFITHRKGLLPPLNFSVLYKIGLLGLVGSTSQIMGYKGINYSSPTLASAISNLTPAFTFILAILFRMEKVALRSSSSQAKIMGTIVSISGAFVVTLYKGPAIVISSSPSKSLHSLASSQSNWVLGSLYLTTEYLLIPVWYIIQAKIMTEYPSELTVVFFYNLCVAIVAAVAGLVAEVDLSAWRVGLNIALISILCSGFFGSFMSIAVHTWALRLKGPVYVAMFKPLSIVIAVAMGVIFLGDTLHLGSVVGATIISLGFYTVMWGKAKEEVNEECGFRSLDSQSTQKTPLLPS
ncbi:WAT1-related protein At3g28050-like [Malania oleifera]|uniref:WAT1-related protein At3g28050-like n=1 Tax=Malania oleifera TaxID=397392 RepID=UPI0025ADED35|nr:WAT1-related protein At3g28050-like [Malania oleifera]